MCEMTDVKIIYTFTRANAGTLSASENVTHVLALLSGTTKILLKRTLTAELEWSPKQLVLSLTLLNNSHLSPATP